jgi:hypothetical protein
MQYAFRNEQVYTGVLQLTVLMAQIIKPCNSLNNKDDATRTMILVLG